VTGLAWRLRTLIARHLAIHGSWYAVEHARSRPSPEVGAQLAAFLAGEPAPGHQAAQVAQLSHELTAEWTRRDDSPDAVLGRITALADRAGLASAGADLLAVIAGPALDRSYARFVRAITGADNVPVWFARDVVDPAGEDIAAVALAWARLIALGVIVERAGGAAVAAEVELWLATGEASAPPGAVLHAPAACAARAALRVQLLPITDAVIAGERVVVLGPRDMGAGWIAAAIAVRTGRAVLAAARASAVVVRAALLADAVLYVSEPDAPGAPGARDAPDEIDGLHALAPTPLAMVIHVACEPRPLAAATLAATLGASLIEIATPSAAERAAWWRYIADELWPGAHDHDAAERLACAALPLETVFEIAASAPSPSALEHAVFAALSAHSPASGGTVSP
jgi:hypothetical protein